MNSRHLPYHDEAEEGGDAMSGRGRHHSASGLSPTLVWGLATLFAVGAGRAPFTKRGWLVSGLEMLLMGTPRLRWPTPWELLVRWSLATQTCEGQLTVRQKSRICSPALRSPQCPIALQR